MIMPEADTLKDATIIGVDLGGTHVRVARVAADGRVLAIRRGPTDREGGPDSVIAQICTMARALGDATTRAIGVGVPGAIEAETGVVLNIPALAGWVRVPLAARLRHALDMPCLLENDAKAATLGEWWAGAGQGSRNFVYVTISTGIGSAAVVDGRLLRGAAGLAGEIGHTRVTDAPDVCACGLTGCWQAVASGAALDRRARRMAVDDPACAVARLAGDAPVTAVQLGTAARAGDAAALRALSDHAEVLGYGLANLQHVYAPERIIVGGGVSALLDLLRPTLQRTLSARLLPGFVPAAIVPAVLGDEAGVVGAAFRAREASQARPGS